MTIFYSTILLLVSIVFCCYPVVPELRGASVLDKSRQPVKPPIAAPTPPPQANPNALKTTPTIPKEPDFEIGYIIPSREGFQKCTTPPGYTSSLINVATNVTKAQKSWSGLFCAKGNVTVTQTNPLLDMTGKKLSFWVIHNELF